MTAPVCDAPWQLPHWPWIEATEDACGATGGLCLEAAFCVHLDPTKWLRPYATGEPIWMCPEHAADFRRWGWEEVGVERIHTLLPAALCGAP